MIHVLRFSVTPPHESYVLCGFTEAPQSEWPAGETWVGVLEWRLATCEKCRKEGQDRSREVLENRTRQT